MNETEQAPPRRENRPKIRAEIRELERKLSATSTSAEREPILAALEDRQRALHRHYAYLRELPRFDSRGNRLPRFTVHAPLEPPRETPDPEETP